MAQKYPLEVEIDKDLEQSMNLLDQAHNSSDDSLFKNDLVKIAQYYYNAIKRIKEICVNRKRF